MSAPAPSSDVAPLRRLLRLAPPRWSVLVAGMASLGVSICLGLVFPLWIRAILDDASFRHGLQWTPGRAALAVGGLLLFALAVFLRYALFHTASEGVVMRIRNLLYANLLEQEIGFFDQTRTGQLTGALSVDTAVLQDALSSNVSMGLLALFTMLGGVTMMVVLSLRLTLVLLGVLPVLLLGAAVFGRRLQRTSRTVQDALADANHVAEEALSGIRTVRTLSAEPAERARYQLATAESFERGRRRALVAGLWNSLTAFGTYGALLSILTVGGMLVAEGRLTVGSLATFVVYALLVASSLGDFSDRWSSLKRASGAAARVLELIERAPGQAGQGTQRLAHVQGRIDFEKVSFSYPVRPDAPVLRELELHVEPGEVVALVGSSGAGKSTVTALLARLYEPGAGAVRVDGVDVAHLDPRWLREQLGTVSQEPVLFSTSIAENIRYGRGEVSPERVEAAARAANAHDFISRFPEGYATRVGERGVQLSGGQKQRVAIARALLRDPRILILDEATSALDSENEFLVQEALGRLMKGRTTLLIAHRLATVKGANRVFVLDGGRVVQSGNHAALMLEDGLYRKLVERQLLGEPRVGEAPRSP